MFALPAAPAAADYFVILHTASDTGRPAEIAAGKVKRALNRKCKVASETTHTGALDGIRDDLMIVFLGSYKRRAEAIVVRNKVRACVPGAYVKEAFWKGD